MSFEEAEAIIRRHMAVGHVFQGVRAAGGDAGAPKPFGSGKLFLSADGREMIALIDEPPAAPQKVLAAWRRVLVPPGSQSPAEVLAALGQKYGSPRNSALRTNAPINWFGPRGDRCAGVYQSGRFIALSEFWTDQGKPAVIATGNAFPTGPLIPLPLLDPLSDQSRMWMDCGPFVTAQYFEAFVAGANASVFTLLADIGSYVSAYAESRKRLQIAPTRAPRASAAVFDGAYGPDLVGVRLGMTFVEAEAAVREHMDVGLVFRRGAPDATAPGVDPRLPGTGALMLSTDQNEVIGLFGAPAPDQGKVAAVWRRVYSPLSVDLDLVTRRATEKYGSPADADDSGRRLAWGAGPSVCGAGDGAAFDERTTFDRRWRDESDAPFSFRAANGEENPDMPALAALADASPPGVACGPRIRLDFRSEQGNPPMNVTEVTLTDPGLRLRILQASREGAAGAGPIKF